MLQGKPASNGKVAGEISKVENWLPSFDSVLHADRVTLFYRKGITKIRDVCMHCYHRIGPPMLGPIPCCKLFKSAFPLQGQNHINERAQRGFESLLFSRHNSPLLHWAEKDGLAPRMYVPVGLQAEDISPGPLIVFSWPRRMTRR